MPAVARRAGAATDAEHALACAPARRRAACVGGGLCSAAPLSNGSCRKVRRLFVIAEFGGGGHVPLVVLRSRALAALAVASHDERRQSFELRRRQWCAADWSFARPRQPHGRVWPPAAVAALRPGARSGRARLGLALRRLARRARSEIRGCNGGGQRRGCRVGCMHAACACARLNLSTCCAAPPLCGPWCVPSLVVRCVLGALVR